MWQLRFINAVSLTQQYTTACRCQRFAESSQQKLTLSAAQTQLHLPALAAAQADCKHLYIESQNAKQVMLKPTYKVAKRGCEYGLEVGQQLVPLLPLCSSSTSSRTKPHLRRGEHVTWEMLQSE
jgi:hypothetical protein